MNFLGELAIRNSDCERRRSGLTHDGEWACFECGSTTRFRNECPIYSDRMESIRLQMENGGNALGGRKAAYGGNLCKEGDRCINERFSLVPNGASGNASFSEHADAGYPGETLVTCDKREVLNSNSNISGQRGCGFRECGRPNRGDGSIYLACIYIGNYPNL